jgi:DNA-binding transcriptional LysR family regulator
VSRRLEIDSLRALRAVADLGGVTRASDSLALSQSAVSHKIRRLEQSIDCRLLLRRPGAPLLTDEGERLLTYAKRILALHDEALTSLGRKNLEGQIRLGITEDTTSAGLARILARFTRLYPSVSVKTHVAQSLVLDRQLADGEIDLAVMQVFEADRRDHDILLWADNLVWVQGLDFESNASKPLPFIAFDKDCLYRQWAFQQANLNNLRIETVLECSSIDGVCSAVTAGLGMALVSRRHLGFGMSVAELDLPTPPCVAYVVRQNSSAASLPVETLTEEIFTEMSTQFYPSRS